MPDSNDFVVRFAGEGGQGVVTSAEGLAQTATQAGFHQFDGDLQHVKREDFENRASHSTDVLE